MSYQKVAAAGAMLKCTLGSIPSMLLPSRASTIAVENKFLATITDSQPIKNIPPFGVCSVTGTACMPLLSTPWLGSIGLPLGVNAPMLPADGKLPCAVGGEIFIADCMQSTVMIAVVPAPPPAKKDDPWGPDFVHDAVDAVGDAVGDAAGALKDYVVENPIDAASWVIPGPGTIFKATKLGIAAGKLGAKLLRGGAKGGGKTVSKGKLLVRLGSPRDLIRTSKPLRVGKGKTDDLYQRPGDFSDAVADLKKLRGSPRKLKPKTINKNGKEIIIYVKQLPGGKKAVARPNSSDSRPTLQIQTPKGEPDIKFRYGQ